MKANCSLSIIVFAAGVLPFSANAEPEAELLELINSYRANPPHCEGAHKGPLLPLKPDIRLSQLEMGAARQLKEAIRAAGFLAARAEGITLSGPSDARAAMRFAEQINCRLLLGPRYSVAGVSRQGREWQIVLAQPLLDARIGNWRQAGLQLLKLVNSVRAKGRSCGNKYYEAASPMAWSARLGAVALAHSRDMAEHNYFGHEGSNGNAVETRASDEGYRWRSIGENVATGLAKPQQVVEGWLSSPGHCVNIMNRSFTEMGAAYAINPRSNTIIYWTQVFGRPR
jgi:uncharacterized protein YkwD